MLKGITYSGEWIEINKAISLFDGFEGFLKAIKDNKIRTRGRIVDAREPREKEGYSHIPYEIWADNDYVEAYGYLENDRYSGADFISRPYRDIEVCRSDLLNLLIKMRFSNVSNELGDIIMLSFINLYIQNTDGSMPSANSVWREIEKNIDAYPCIAEITTNSNNEGIIKWQSLTGALVRPMPFGTFKNKISDIASMIKEIEKS